MATSVAKKPRKTSAKAGAKRTAARPAAKPAKRPAKKAAKKSARKGAARPAAHKKTAKKAGAKPSARKPASKPAKKVDPTAPRPVGSGKGPTPAEVGAGVLEMVRAGKPETEIWAKWFSPKLISIENMPTGGMAWHGVKAVKAKGEAWMQENAIHSVEAEGPYAGATGFAIRYTMTVEHKPTGNTFTMSEVGVYTVKNGKVVLEEFMYGQ